MSEQIWIEIESIGCNCGCGFNAIHPKILGMVESLAYRIMLPIRIISFCRCEAHNRSEGGAADSGHLPYFWVTIIDRIRAAGKMVRKMILKPDTYRVGIAVDVTCQDCERLYNSAIDSGEWTGVIWYKYKNKKRDRLHLDLKPRTEPYYKILEMAA